MANSFVNVFKYNFGGQVNYLKRARSSKTNHFRQDGLSSCLLHDQFVLNPHGGSFSAGSSECKDDPPLLHHRVHVQGGTQNIPGFITN